MKLWAVDKLTLYCQGRSKLGDREDTVQGAPTKTNPPKYLKYKKTKRETENDPFAKRIPYTALLSGKPLTDYLVFS